MKLENISTPALIIDQPTFDNNALKMQALLQNSNLRLRPHFKSHKCSSIAKKQMENGAVGITCAKLDEAIDLADSGIENILIANQIVDFEKLTRLAFLAKSCKLTVCVDNAENILNLEKAVALAESKVYCLIEYEIGMERCGVSSEEDVVKLYKLIDSCPHLEFEGIQAYAGHVSHEISLEEREKYTLVNTDKLKSLINTLSQNGILVKTVSGGSTGTSVIKAKSDVYTELQAGSYLFMDATYSLLNLPFEQSLYILTTVVSVSENIAVVDAGVKSCGVDQGMPVVKGFDVSKVVASEEHFQLHNPSKKLNVGDKVLLIPAHCCSTVNLHNKLYMINDGKVVDRITVTARGCFH